MLKRQRSVEAAASSKKSREQSPSGASTSTLSPDDAVTHILSWNVETPAPFLDLHPNKITGYTKSLPSNSSGHAPNALRALIERHQFPHFVCLQEVCARHTDKDWIRALQAASNSSGRADPATTYTMHHSLSRATRGQRHFGVATYVRRDVAEQVSDVREVEWDKEGRVLILEMRSGWALVNVYALNGSEAIWHDPMRPGDRSSTRTRNERKREFNKLLRDECRRMQARGLHLVLIGDFNISLAKVDCYPRLRTEHPHALARREFNEDFMPPLGLVDIFREIHGQMKGYSWFAHGKPQYSDCARVDYALVERKLLEDEWLGLGRVVEASYLEDRLERAHSDHAPVVLKLRGMDALQ